MKILIFFKFGLALTMFPSLLKTIIFYFLPLFLLGLVASRLPTLPRLRTDTINPLKFLLFKRYWRLSSTFSRMPWSALLQLFKFTWHLFQHPWLVPAHPSEWFHWAKLEDQKPSGIVAEIQHLSSKYYGFWVFLWYLNVYLTQDID